MIIKAAEDILKPSVDTRSYRYVELKNGMKCFLCFDPTTEKSAACCSVQVGSMCDPVEAQGLAHFLEHMLFMGTEKYPQENEYSAFLNNHGGSSNAYTAQENTVYYFDVQSEHFTKALDLFASFFTCPLFTESATSREINAVDSENSKNLQSDSWRKYQLFKNLARSDHPLVNFSTGNLQTLGDAPTAAGTNIRDMMIAFYKQYYSANLMNVVLCSNLPLDEQQQLVESLFLAVPSQSRDRPSFPSDPYTSKELGKFVEICPVRDIKTLDLLFPIPASDHLYMAKPHRYLAHLFGHESEGSILSALKKRLWANNLSSFKYQSCKDFGCFSVSIELSDEGMEHILEVMAMVFAYSGMLLRLGPQAWVIKEMAEVAAMQFRFQDKVEPQDYVVSLANGMDFYQPAHVIAGDTLIFDEHDLTSVSHFLSFITPENCLVFLQHKGCEGKSDMLHEKWYGTPYTLRAFTVDEVSAWTTAYAGGTSYDSVLALPEKNPFIPTDFALKEIGSDGEKTVPELVSSAVHPSPLSLAIAKQKQATSAAAASAAAAATDGEGSEKTMKRQRSEQGLEMVTIHGEDGQSQGEGESSNGAEDYINNDTNGSEVQEKEGVDGIDEDDGDDEDEKSLPPSTAALTASNLDQANNTNGWLQSLAGESSATWHRLDGHWTMPKAHVNISLETQFASSTAWNAVQTDLLSRLLKEILNEFAYYADCAGLYQEVSLTRAGLSLSCSGYGHKLPVLIERTVQELQRLGLGLNLTTELFTRVKEKMVRAYKNELYGQPYRLTMLACSVCLEEPRFSLFEKLQALNVVDISAFQAFIKQFLSQMRIEVLVNGNMTSDEAKGLSVMLSKALPSTVHLPYVQEPVRRAVQLAVGGNRSYVYRESAWTYNPAEVNSAVTIMYMLNTMIAGHNGKNICSAEEVKQRLHTEAMESLIVRLLSEPAFDQLRTKEQLGYIVFVTRQRVAQHLMNITFIVQSKAKDPVHLDQRVEAFLLSYRETLATMTEEELQTLINAEKEKLLEKPKNLDEESGNFWSEVSKGTYLFDRNQQLHAALSESGAFTVETVRAFYDAYLTPTGVKRCKFSAQFFGKDAVIPSKEDIAAAQGEGQEEIIIVDDPALFKRHLPLLPMPRYLPL